MSFFARAKSKIDAIVNNPNKRTGGKIPSAGSHSVLQSEFGSTLPSSSNGSDRGGSHHGGGSSGQHLGHLGGSVEGTSHRGTSPTNTALSDETGGSQGHQTPSRAMPTASENLIMDELTADDIDLDKLKRLCWSGCPDGFRAECWGVLTGYYPLSHANREIFMKRKRGEYRSYVVSSYSNIDWARLLEQGDHQGSLSSPGVSQPERGANDDDDDAASLKEGAEKEGSTLVVGAEELAIMKQIRKDLPRAGNVKVLHCARIQAIMERVLYIWAVRHPACGYVQGMNDLVYPFLYVLLVDHVAAANSRVSYFVGQKTVEEAEEILKTIGGSYGHTSAELIQQQQQQQLLEAPGAVSEEREAAEVSSTVPNSPMLSPRALQQQQHQQQVDADWANFEADLYWNVSRVMEKVQVNYTFNQAGCHAMIKKLEELIKVVDPTLYKHLVEKLEIQFFNFSFRWMNCLLLREVNPMQALRLWDTYLCEEDYSCFHVYVCCELLVRWSPQLRKINDSGDALSFLQSPPTHLFRDRDLDEVVSAAFVLQQTYDKSFKHLLECQDQEQQQALGSQSKRSALSSNNSSLGGISKSSTE